MALLIDGKRISAEIKDELKEEVAPLEQMHPRQPLQLSATCCHRI